MRIIKLLVFVAFSYSWVASASEQHESFLECFKKDFKNYTSISSLVYTPMNSSYTSTLLFSIRNLRFATKSTPKPLVIITPEHESQVPPIIYCAQESKLQIQTRSGGHDFEGLSYVSKVPFVLIDLINLSEITIDLDDRTAWVGGGATIGSLYYKITENSQTLGFPAGHCPSMGVGGHISGGGYGFMIRKYGMAADNIVDARIVDVQGRILDRSSMGEDLFWAIRGGTGASFGVILAWKLQLVDVPEKVTVCTLNRNLEQNATELVYRWQYVANKVDPNLFIAIILSRVNTSQKENNLTVNALFYFTFLGGINRLLAIIKEDFLELGLVRENCREMSWINATITYSNLSGYTIETHEDLLNRTQPNVINYKVKSDYVQKPISKGGLDGAWRFLFETEAVGAVYYLVPYGGVMDEIPNTSIPYAHRAGNLYQFSTQVSWGENEAPNSSKYIEWIRRFYKYMTPYVSKSPRRAYLNYRDLDIGTNNIVGEVSYARAKVWGEKYFENNFDRLVQVKTSVDPENFFWNEQSIPPVHSQWTKARN